MTPRPAALIIARSGPLNDIPLLPWLEATREVRPEDRFILSDADWDRLIEGDSELWRAFERKLLVNVYLRQPDLIAIIGHCLGRPEVSIGEEQEQVERLVSRLRWYGLPAAVVGFWTDGGWQLDGVIEPEREEAELEADLSLV